MEERQRLRAHGSLEDGEEEGESAQAGGGKQEQAGLSLEPGPILWLRPQESRSGGWEAHCTLLSRVLKY